MAGFESSPNNCLFNSFLFLFSDGPCIRPPRRFCRPAGGACPWLNSTWGPSSVYPVVGGGGGEDFVTLGCFFGIRPRSLMFGGGEGLLLGLLSRFEPPFDFLESRFRPSPLSFDCPSRPGFMDFVSNFSPFPLVDDRGFLDFGRTFSSLMDLIGPDFSCFSSLRMDGGGGGVAPLDAGDRGDLFPFGTFSVLSSSFFEDLDSDFFGDPEAESEPL